MDEQEIRSKELKVTRKYRKAIFPLDSGDVEITYPANLTEDDLDTLHCYLGTFLKMRKPMTKLTKQEHVEA